MLSLWRELEPRGEKAAVGWSMDKRFSIKDKCIWECCPHTRYLCIICCVPAPALQALSEESCVKTDPPRSVGGPRYSSLVAWSSLFPQHKTSFRQGGVGWGGVVEWEDGGWGMERWAATYFYFLVSSGNSQLYQV